MSKQYISLLSGGMDSSTVTATVVRNFGAEATLALGFNYGQRHGQQELSAAGRVARSLNLEFRVIDLTSLTAFLKGSALTDDTISVPEGHYEAPSMKQTVVPNRNAIMLAIAFGVARGLNASTVYAGMHSGDHHIYPDCRPEFTAAFDRMEALANADLEPWQIPHLMVPFIGLKKHDLVTQAKKVGLDLGLTYSCYNGEETHCGVCGTCTERREAFILANLPDPTQYQRENYVSV